LQTLGVTADLKDATAVMVSPGTIVLLAALIIDIVAADAAVIWTDLAPSKCWAAVLAMVVLAEFVHPEASVSALASFAVRKLWAGL
jgi:hypothetical protein